MNTLDIYYCESGEEFAVKDGKEPKLCPFCGNSEIGWSHERRIESDGHQGKGLESL